MKFRIVINRIWHIASSNLWLLEGEKTEGDLTHGFRGTVQLHDREILITIKSVAMVDGGKIDLRRVLLSIEKPECDPRLLEGRELISTE